MYFVSGNNTVPLNVALTANKQKKVKIKIEAKARTSQNPANESDDAKDTVPTNFFSALFSRATILGTPKASTSISPTSAPLETNFDDFL